MKTFYSGIFPVLVALVLFPLNSHSEQSQSVTQEEKPSLAQRLKKSDFFLIRLFTKKGVAADSVIHSVENLWKSANSYYSERKFLQASQTAEQIIPSWNSYIRSLRRVHKVSLFDSDRLRSFIRVSNVYNNISPSVLSLTKVASTFPATEDELIEHNRHDLLAQLDSVHKEILDTVSHYPRDSLTVLHAYRFIVSAALKVDTLFGLVYDQQRLDFSLKNKFYYNRMQKSNNPKALEEYVDDCDYYGTDKEWCERARKILHPDKSSAKSFESASIIAPASSRKVSASDTINEQFAAVTTSRNIDQLETYIKKYSSKKFRKVARVDSVQTLLNTIRKEIQSEKLFASEHPYFSDGNDMDKLFTLKIQGLQEYVITALQPVTDSFTIKLSSLRSLRFPAVLLIDYAATPPLYLLNCYIHEKKDMTIVDSSGQWYCTIDGIKRAFSELDLLTRKCTEQLKRTGVQFNYPPVFAIRVLKNSMSYLTMYACGKNADGYELYKFYDVTIPGFQNVRMVNNSVNAVIKIPDDNNTQENRVAREFFGR